MLIKLKKNVSIIWIYKILSAVKTCLNCIKKILKGKLGSRETFKNQN